MKGLIVELAQKHKNSIMNLLVTSKYATPLLAEGKLTSRVCLMVDKLKINLSILEHYIKKN